MGATIKSLSIPPMAAWSWNPDSSKADAVDAARMEKAAGGDKPTCGQRDVPGSRLNYGDLG